MIIIPNTFVDELLADISANALECYLLIACNTSVHGKELGSISEPQLLEKAGTKNIKTVRAALAELTELGAIEILPNDEVRIRFDVGR